MASVLFYCFLPSRPPLIRRVSLPDSFVFGIFLSVFSLCRGSSVWMMVSREYVLHLHPPRSRNKLQPISQRDLIHPDRAAVKKRKNEGETGNGRQVENIIKKRK